jgi:peroxiredoxin Q/BCP
VAKLEAGLKAPAFRLKDGGGAWVSLKDDILGSRAVIYFYPKDDTPGCTKEACSFRDHSAELRKRRVKVYGISADTEASHQKFAAKYTLRFPLLCDPGHVVARAYGAYGEKTMYGKKVTGVIRSTILLEGDGRIAHIWRKVDTARHAQEILTKLDELDARA